MQDCRGVTLRGLTVDYDPMPFTQGTIAAVAEDKGWIDVKLHAGYPRKPYSRIDVVDPATRFRKRGMPFLWGTKSEMRGDDVVRVSLKDIGKTAVPGDLASLSTGQAADGIPHAMAIENCSAVILQGVTIHSAPGMGILECDGEGGSSLLGCRVVPGPKPAGATEARLLSSSWDAIQSKTMRKGPRMENCEIRDAGDDSWSVQSSDFLVVAKSGPTAVIAFRDEYCQGPLSGDRLARTLDSPQAVIVTRKRAELRPPFVTEEVEKRLKEAPQWTKWHVSRKAIEITVSGGSSPSTSEMPSSARTARAAALSSATTGSTAPAASLSRRATRTHREKHHHRRPLGHHRLSRSSRKRSHRHPESNHPRQPLPRQRLLLPFVVEHPGGLRFHHGQWSGKNAAACPGLSKTSSSRTTASRTSTVPPSSSLPPMDSASPTTRSAA